MFSHATRVMLPKRRSAATFDLQFRDQCITVTVGCYPDGSIGEVFITGPKVGSGLEATARDSAVLLSVALQYGVPLSALRHSVTREQDGTPSTIVGAVLDHLEGHYGPPSCGRTKPSAVADPAVD